MMRTLSILGLFSSFLLIKLAEHLSTADSYGVVGNQLLKEGAAGGFFDITTMLGLVIVFLFYWFKFNEWAGPGVAPKGFRPRPARHFTTWLRFLGWNSFYGLLMVGACAGLIFFPDLIFGMLGSFATASNTLHAPIPGLSEAHKLFGLLPLSGEMFVYDPIYTSKIAPYAVMITTVLWAGMRPFSEFERRFRLRLQERAAIPTEARSLIEIFKKEMDTFVPEEKIIDEILKEQHGRLNRKSDFSDSGDDLWFLMARAQYLYHLLLKYNREPVFSRLAERYSGEFKGLSAMMMKVHVLATQRITDIHRIANDARPSRTGASGGAGAKPFQKTTQPETLKDAEQLLSEKLSSATKFEKIYFQKQEKNLRSVVKKTSEEIIQLIVCSVLAVGRSRQQCRDLLDAFGLKQHNRISKQMDWVVITWLAVGALFIVFFCSLAFFFLQPQTGNKYQGLIPEDINEVLYWAVASCFLHLLAAVGGYFCQRSLESGRERLQLGAIKERALSPAAQVAEALCSAGFGFSLSIFLLGALKTLGGEFPDLFRSWWWALVPTVTALFAALYTQRVKRSKKKLKSLLWAQGGATGIVSAVVFLLLYSHDLTNTWGFGCFVTITATILGTSLGIILQKWVEGVEKAADKAGAPDQRKAERQRPIFMRAKWCSDLGPEIFARVLNISQFGAELKTKTPLAPETEGTVKIGKEEHRARVVRNANDDVSHIYVEFLKNAA